MGFLKYIFRTKKSAAGTERVTKEPGTFYSPMKGTVIPLSEVEDPMFSQGIMGKGVGIRPTQGKLYAPVDGEVAAVFPTGHAVGIKTREGMEVLLHIGIDTVSMNGDGFHAVVKQGDPVQVGSLLVEFDRKKIQAAGLQETTMLLVTNLDNFGEMTLPVLGEVEKGERLFSVCVYPDQC